MSAVDVVLQVFRSVEERNPQLAAEVYHDDLEFHWPRAKPARLFDAPNRRFCKRGGLAATFTLRSQAPSLSQTGCGHSEPVR